MSSVAVLQQRVLQVINDCFKEHEEALLRGQDTSVLRMHEEILDLRSKLKQQQQQEECQYEHPRQESGVSTCEVPVEPSTAVVKLVQLEPSWLNDTAGEGPEVRAAIKNVAEDIAIRPEYWEAQQHYANRKAHHHKHSLLFDDAPSAMRGAAGKMKSIRRNLRKVPLRPDSSTHLAFELLSVVVLVHDSIMVPLTLCWDLSSERPVHVLMMVSLAVWTVDLLMNFMTGYLRSDGTIEMNRFKVWVHYLKTWFSIDFTVVAAEWTAMILEFVQTSSEGSDGRSGSLVRLTKIGKFSRFLHVLVAIRLLRIAPKYGRNLGLSATWSIVPQIIQILTSIVYINHVNGCMWFLIGRTGYEGDDTGGRSWLNQMLTDEGPSYYHAGFVFQYFTSVHWSITQMTPGSMEVTPKNSYERMWNIICLLFGLIFGSTLVGQLSSKMVQFNMARSQELKRMENLRKFLHENGVDIVLSRRVQQQAQQRLLGKVRLMEEDVEDLKNLPSELRSQLHTTIYAQYFMRHPLFCMWNVADATVCRAVCTSGALRMKGLLVGNDLFTPASPAKESWLLLKGNMRYQRVLREEEYVTGKNGEDEEPRKELDVAGNRWLAEVVLWFKWCFAGTLQAESACEFVALECDLLIRVIQIHGRLAELAFTWCAAFKQALVISHMDGEVEVGISPSRIIMSLPEDIRAASSECALAAIRGEGLMSRFMNLNGMVPISADALEKEMREGSCVLAVQASGEFLRTVHVVALKLNPSLDDEKFLVQLARLRVGQREDVEGTWEPALQLPGMKVRIGDDQEKAVGQIVQDNLAELSSAIDYLGRPTLTAEVKESRSYGVQTEYLRTVFAAHLRPDAFLPSTGTVLGLEADLCLAELEVHVRKGANGKMHLCAWVTEAEFRHLQMKSTELASHWFPDLSAFGLKSPGAHSFTLKALIQRAQTDMTVRAQSTMMSSNASSATASSQHSRTLSEVHPSSVPFSDNTAADLSERCDSI